MKKALLTFFVFIVAVFQGIAQNRDGETYAIKEIVNRWNSSHHMSTVNDLAQLYGDSVFYYGKELGKESCIKGKAFWLSHYAGFNQQIASPIKITFYKSGSIKCSFTKRTSYQQAVEEFEAYLLLQKSGDTYVITGEGDATSDSRTGTVLNLGEEELAADTAAITTKIVKAITPVAGNQSFLSLKWIVIPAAILIAACVFFVWLFRKNKIQASESIYPQASGAGLKFDVAEVDQSDEDVTGKKVAAKKKANKKHDAARIDESIAASEFINDIEKIEIKRPAQPVQVQNILDPEENPTAMQFEKYVMDRFDKDVFKCLSWQRSNAWLPKSGRNPDMEFKVELKTKSVFFAVECKWRQEFYNGQVDLAKQHELENYRKYQYEKNIKVFIVLGMGGEPSDPDTVYIIPLDKVNSAILEESQLRRYRRFRNSNFFLDTTLMQLR